MRSALRGSSWRHPMRTPQRADRFAPDTRLKCSRTSNASDVQLLDNSVCETYTARSPPRRRDGLTGREARSRRRRERVRPIGRDLDRTPYKHLVLHERSDTARKEKAMNQYKLPDLPYDFGALEPHVSGKIMELHHGKHHAGYVKGANATLERLAEARTTE